MRKKEISLIEGPIKKSILMFAIPLFLGQLLQQFYNVADAWVIGNFADNDAFAAGFHWGVAGAAIATVIAQGLSVILCITRMCRIKDYTCLDVRKIRYHKDIMREVIKQGMPMGLQNAVVSIRNMTVQANINSFGSYAKIERAKKGAKFGIFFGMIAAKVMGLLCIFLDTAESLKYGRIHLQTRLTGKC